MTDTTTEPVRGEAKLRHTEDGRVLLTISQSWLGSHSDCPEKARRDLLGLAPRIDTDATSLGTAVHFAIERACNCFIESGEWPRLEDSLHVFDDEWAVLAAKPELQWVKRTEAAAAAYGRECVAAWWFDIRPNLSPESVELPLGPATIYEDTRIVVQLVGTCDLLDKNKGLVDWKTASRSYIGWEKDRWAIQPTVYLWLLRQMFGPEVNPDFTFVVFVDKGNAGVEVQEITVLRTPEHDAWLREQVKDIAELVLADLPRWTRRDASALCSPKWCPSWDTCKGEHIKTPKWARPLETEKE